MADTPVANVPSVVTIILGGITWLIRHSDISDLAGFVTICVGVYTLYINYPRFKERIKETFKKKNAKPINKKANAIHANNSFTIGSFIILF